MLQVRINDPFEAAMIAVPVFLYRSTPLSPGATPQVSTPVDDPEKRAAQDAENRARYDEAVEKVTRTTSFPAFLADHLAN